MDDEMSHSLLQLLLEEGVVPSPKEEMKRADVISNLEQVALSWVKKVAWQRRLPKNQIADASTKILTYGSHFLGVHESESEIDALCVGPSFATIEEDFFIVLQSMLQSKKEVSEIHCVIDKMVPLLRLKFNGISVDLTYAKLTVPSVPNALNIVDPFFLRLFNKASLGCLSGIRANIRILQLVPNLKNFQAMLRCIRLWARKRGIYCYLLGLFGGIHLAVLSAYVCQKNPNASVCSLVSKFFEKFALWPWPKPVTLEDVFLPEGEDFSEANFLMPIGLPCSPYEVCHSKITRRTFQRIMAEFLRGHDMTRDLERPSFEWNSLFDSFLYTKTSTRFIKIFLAAPNQEELADWVGWVKSRLHNLLLKLEAVQGFCNPNPFEYVDPTVEEPHTIFYWGLQPGRSRFTDTKSMEEDFMKHIEDGYDGPYGDLEISVTEMPKISLLESKGEKPFNAYSKLFDYHELRKPLHSKLLPHYCIGYAASDEEVMYPISVA